MVDSSLSLITGMVDFSTFLIDSFLIGAGLGFEVDCFCVAGTGPFFLGGDTFVCDGLAYSLGGADFFDAGALFSFF